MIEDKGWLWKHYTKEENTNLIKCNNCGRIFFNSNRREDLIYHLYDDHNKKEIDEHPERDIILQNFKISKVSLLATCNHCTGIINCAIQGVHVLTYHLKCIHWDKCYLKTPRKERKPNLFRNYYTRNGKETCKKCNKQIKLTNLRSHANTDCLQRVKQEQKNLSIRNKFVVKDNEATCKKCEKIIKRNKNYPLISSLKRHLCHRPNKKPKISSLRNQHEYIEGNKAKCKKRERIPQSIPFLSQEHANSDCLQRTKQQQQNLSIRDKFVIKDNEATCKKCEKTIKGNKIYPLILYLKRHLCHLPHEEKHEIHSIWNQYKRIEDNKAKCKKCKKTLKAVTLILQHHAATDCLRKVKQKQENLLIPNKFIIKDNEATCKGCTKTIKLNKNSYFLIPYLKCHLRRCSNKKPKVSSLRNQYEYIEGCKAKCKKCKKILESRKYTLQMHENFDCVNEKPEISSVRDQFEYIGDFKAKCRKCEKTLTLRKTTLKRHENFDCVQRMKQEQKNLLIRNKFVIKKNEATCKGCGKIIKINQNYRRITHLKNHLSRCPNEKLEISSVRDQYEYIKGSKAKCKECKIILKKKNSNLLMHAIFDCLNKKPKISSLWDQYEYIEGNKAKCKNIPESRKCTLQRHGNFNCVNEKPEISSVRDQFEYIGDFKAKCKKVLESRRNTLQRHENIDCVLKQEQKNLSIRNKKFVIKENEATCKGCGKIIKINQNYPRITHLKNHLSRCPNEKPEISSVRDQYEYIEGNKAKCRKCKKILEPTKQTLQKHENIDCVQRMKRDQKNLSLRNNFVIKENEATCKGCQKTIKIKKTTNSLISYLKGHFLHCPNEELEISSVRDQYEYIEGFKAKCKTCKIILNAKNDNLLRHAIFNCEILNCLNEVKQEIHSIWDQYKRIEDNKAKCKKCKKTLKAVTSILQHHAATDCLRKVEQKQENLSILNKFVMKDNEAMCKGCAETIKLNKNSNFLIPYLKLHLRRCLNKKPEISSVWDQYDQYEYIEDNKAKCKKCEKILTLQNYILWKHANSDCLRKVKQKRESLSNKFVIKDNEATCKECEKIIKLSKTFSYYLIRHLKSHLCHCPNEKLEISSVRDQYEYIEGNKAKCKKCKKILNMKARNFSLRIHANSDCLQRMKREQKNLSIWNKFVIKENEATCKECEKTIKINKTEHLMRDLKGHLLCCSKYEKPEILSVRDQYEYIEGHKAKCKKCKNVLNARNSNLLRHAISDCLQRIKQEQKNLSIRNKFVIKENEATCKGCGKIIKINLQNYPLITHLKIHLSRCPDEATQEIHSIWDQYERIEDNETKCKKRERIPQSIPFTSRKHANSDCLQRIRQKQTNLSIRNKFVIKKNEATCKGCKKTIKLNKTSFLIPYLKKHRCLNKKPKMLSVRDQYEYIEGNRAKCKKCQKTLKVVTWILRYHASTDCLRRVKQEQENLSIRNKFVIKENEMTCKECKKTIKVNKIYPPITYLKSHLIICPNKEKQKIYSIWDQYEYIEDNKAKCKKCQKTLEAVTLNLQDHAATDCLQRKKQKQQNLSIRNKFIIKENEATCKRCVKKIKINKTYPLITYLKIHLCRCPNKKEEEIRSIWKQYECMKQQQKILSNRNKFVIKENEATCKGCKKTMKIKKISLIRSLNTHLLDCPNEEK